MSMLKRTLLLTLLAGTALAQGSQIMVSPNRIIFENGQKTAEAAITNNTAKTVRYRIDTINQIMLENGSTVVTDTFAYSAKDMVRFMPRTIELAPGKRQTIRIMATRPKDLPEGDYHSHLLFNEIVMPLDPVSSTIQKEGNKVSMNIGMSYSLGVPLIVQQGDVSSSINLVNAQLVRNENGAAEAVEMRLARTGNAESMIRVTGKMQDGKDAFPPRNVRIYRERDDVNLRIKLDPSTTALNPQEVTLNLYSGKNEKSAPVTTQLLK